MRDAAGPLLLAADPDQEIMPGMRGLLLRAADAAVDELVRRQQERGEA
jgi:hypothetical protein